MTAQPHPARHRRLRDSLTEHLINRLPGDQEISCQLGQHEQAECYLRQALEVSRPLGAQSLEAVALTKLADVYDQQHRTTEATTLYHQALAICRRIGSRDGEIDALISSSHILLATALTMARQTR